MRLQGDPLRRRPPAAAPGHRRRVVLRHGAARPGAAGRSANPRGAGRLGRRPRLAGGYSGHCACGSSRDLAPDVDSNSRRHSRPGAARRWGAVRGVPGTQIRRDRRREHARLPRDLLAAANGYDRCRGQRHRPDRHSGRQHGGQSPFDLRCPWPGVPRPPPSRRPRGTRVGTVHHQRLGRVARCRRPCFRRGGRARRPRCRQRRRNPRALPSPPMGAAPAQLQRTVS